MSSIGKQDTKEITNVINRDKKSLSDHGQKLFDAINCFLDDDEQRLLTQALFKYQQDHNVFTLVRSCCEIFDTKRKKSLMLFMRPVIPIRDRFHYDEYYKLFFPDEFGDTKGSSKSIFADLIPNELIEKTIEKAKAKSKKSEDEVETEVCASSSASADPAISTELNTTESATSATANSLEPQKAELNLDFDINKIISADSSTETPNQTESQVVRIGGFRIIELKPKEDESLGFNICLGPTQTFIMVSFVEKDSHVDKLGMKVGDEIVSVNEISLKMTTVDEAIGILSSFDQLHIVLQTSGFMPEDCENEVDNEQTQQSDYNWIDPFNLPIREPRESVQNLKKHLRKIKIKLNKKNFLNELETLGITIRGGIEYELGVFVVNVEQDSLAFKAGLRVGDQILKVNRQSFSHVTLLNALNIFKTSLKLALVNVSNDGTISATLDLLVRYVGKLPTSFIIKLKDINLSYLLISNNNELKKRLDTRYIQNRLDNFKIKMNYLMILSNKANIDPILVKYHLIDYLKFNLNIDYLIYLFKRYVKKNVEIVEALREFIYDWDLELYDSYTFDLKFSLLSLHNRNLKKQINYENFEKPETLFNLNYIEMKSSEDITKLNYNENSSITNNRHLSKSLPNRNYKKNKRTPFDRSKSLDNLNYFLLSVSNENVEENSKHGQLDEATIDNLMKNYKIPHLVSISKVKPSLGSTIYGGVDTQQIIPCILNVQPNTCADTQLKEGQLILNVNQSSLLGLKYRQVSKLLQDTFKSTKKNETIDFIIAEPN